MGILKAIHLKKYYGNGKNTVKAVIGKDSDAFELTDNLGSPIGSYSHGMRQKLALVSAFIRRPKLLILDEPFVGLDPSAAHLMKGYLSELCQNGSAVFFSTHVLEVAEKLCDQIAIIKNGKLVQSGPTAELVGDSSLENVFLELEGEMKKFFVLLKVSIQSMLLPSTNSRGCSKKRAATGLSAVFVIGFLGLYLSGLYSYMFMKALWGNGGCFWPLSCAALFPLFWWWLALAGYTVRL